MREHEDSPPLLPPDNASARAEAVDLNGPTIPPAPALPRELRATTEPTRELSPEQASEILIALRAYVENEGTRLMAFRAAVKEDIDAAFQLAVGAVEGSRKDLLDAIGEARAEVRIVQTELSQLRRNLFGAAESAMSAHDAIGDLQRRLSAIHPLVKTAAGHHADDKISDERSATGAGE